jgi:hypothetical protein
MDDRLAERIRPLNDARREGRGEFVLWWAATALRVDENPALEVAIAEANARRLPVVVYQDLTWRARWATDRRFRFVLEGVPGLARDLEARGVTHLFRLERGPGDPAGALLDLARRADFVVTEEFPAGGFARRRGRLAAAAGVPVVAVDTACVLPMRLVGRAYERAFAFRAATERQRLERLDAPLARVDPVVPPWEGDPGFAPIAVKEEAIPALVASCAIDHGVGAVPGLPGGEAAALARWEAFREKGLGRYAETRNDAAGLDGVSRLSPYLHFGMVSAARIAREARAAGGAGAARYLDELLTWRELAWSFCFHRPDHASVTAIPGWARESLARAQAARDLPPREAIERGATGDPLWDLAQRSLLAHGELHNNVRMTWGKRLLEWTRSPEEGLALAEELNHRWALDGRDPSSYGGLLWCLGQFDRPFPPERPLLGLVRPRPTAEHAKRLGLERYARAVNRPRGNPSPVLVVGAGAAGLLAARTLADHGLEVTVVDKARGAGGRLATRRLGDGSSFDHGAALFDPVTASFRRRLATWEEDGLVERLENAAAGGREDGGRAFRVCGPATSLAKHLARGLDVRLGAKAVSLARDVDGLVLALEDGTALRGAAAILTPPVPQALDLLARGGLAGRLPEELRAALAAVVYNPGLVLLLRLDRRVAAIPPAGLLALRDGGPVARIVENARDGGPSRLSVYARESVAAERFDAPPLNTATALEDAALSALGLGAEAVLERDLKRWRYARPSVPFPGEVPLVDVGGAPLLFAGDAFGQVEAVPPTGNTGLERAALAGLAAAGRLLGLSARVRGSRGKAAIPLSR